LFPTTARPETTALVRLAELAAATGATEIAVEAEALVRRTTEGRFHLACVGEFKRGKSTLINALLHRPVLPTGIVPVTSVPTVLRYGEERARVNLGGRWRSIGLAEVADYVSQARNPNNEKRVTVVEVFLEHPLLADGLCLVDTPGLGSVFDANSETTAGFLPHIDAAIVVLGADPPISGDELRFTVELARQVDTLLFVLNKSDRIPPEHRDEAVAFSTRVLEQALGRTVEPIYQISALSPSATPGSAEGWHALVGALERLPYTSGRRLAGAAARRGTDRLGSQLAALLQEERQALTQPLADSERRIQELANLVTGAASSRYEIGPLLAAEEHRLAEAFRSRRVAFLEQVLPDARAELLRRFAAPAGSRRLGRKDALSLANELARERLASWLLKAEQAAEVAYTEAISRFQQQAQAIIERLTAALGINQSAVQLDTDVWSGFQANRGFYFTNLMDRHDPATPWAWLGDILAPRSTAWRRQTVAAENYLDDLLSINAERVENDLRDRVHESGRRLQTALDRLFADVGRSATLAVERGRAARAAGADAIHEALQRLDARIEQVATLRREADRSADLE